jgi:hypothetical protein
MQNWDISLLKNIPIRERIYFQLRLEAFNAFNHPNFNDKNYVPSVNGPWAYSDPATPLSIAKNVNWGSYSDTYTGTGGARVVQLGAKFIF